MKTIELIIVVITAIGVLVTALFARRGVKFQEKAALEELRKKRSQVPQYLREVQWFLDRSSPDWVNPFALPNLHLKEIAEAKACEGVFEYREATLIGNIYNDLFELEQALRKLDANRTGWYGTFKGHVFPKLEERRSPKLKEALELLEGKREGR